MSEQSRRREQPQVAVKEKQESARPEKKGGLFDDLFGGLKNPLVPGGQPPKPREETLRSQDTLTPRIPPKESAHEQAKPKSSPRPAPRKQKQESSNNAALVLLTIVAAAVLWFGYQKMNADNVSGPIDDGGASAGGQITDLRERVEYYRKSVGHKLNRERVGTEYENRTSAPRIDGQAKKAAEPDMMQGLPLATEQHHRVSSRDRAEPTNPDYADTHVAYSLREQQQVNEADRRAQKQYVDEFVANAAKAGYKVKIDKSGNVEVVGRLPAAGATSGPSSSGSMQ